MMTRTVVALAAVLMAAAPLAGCANKADGPKASDDHQRSPKTETIEVSYDDLLNQKQISRSIDLSVGDHLQVSLGSNASTGYHWVEKMLISDPKVMSQTGHELVAGASQPGAPGSEVWMLEAMAPGNTTVSTTYGQPWPGGEKDSWVFSVNVAVH